MAAYTLSAGEHGVYQKTLVASTVDTITCVGHTPPAVQVFNFDAANPIYVTGDGSAPTIAAQTAYEVPASGNRPVPVTGDIADGTVGLVKVIGAGTGKYSLAVISPIVV